ncbi:MAG: transglutaminase, partial [Tardiphaga sp.]|uniref:transglutaminase-like cysteine peptidase n=1 Tax=Tardiphaga sp. TaxID=1926292 RepID=UPI00261A2A4D
MFRSKGHITGLAFAAVLFGFSATAQAGDERLYASLGDNTRSPIGWVEFCADNPGDCRGGATQARDIVITQTAWKDLLRVNRWVNETVKPLTDMDHWGVIEKWSLPTDGYGDCEDYVLLKRKMLIDAGWPREALLITVVRDKKGEGHAVLTVKTDKGEFVLDNQNESVVA